MLFLLFLFFFFNDTAPTAIYTLSLHDALPISAHPEPFRHPPLHEVGARLQVAAHDERAHLGEQLLAQWWPVDRADDHRSEEHTSELQSRLHLVCRLLLEKKKKKKKKNKHTKVS